MYQTSDKTKSGHRRQQEHLEQIHNIKYLALTGLTAQGENGWCGFWSKLYYPLHILFVRDMIYTSGSQFQSSSPQFLWCPLRRAFTKQHLKR